MSTTTTIRFGVFNDLFCVFVVHALDMDIIRAFNVLIPDGTQLTDTQSCLEQEWNCQRCKIIRAVVAVVVFPCQFGYCVFLGCLIDLRCIGFLFNLPKHSLAVDFYILEWIFQDKV